jgi:hypothetical protein
MSRNITFVQLNLVHKLTLHLIESRPSIILPPTPVFKAVSYFRLLDETHAVNASHLGPKFTLTQKNRQNYVT